MEREREKKKQCLILPQEIALKKNEVCEYFKTFQRVLVFLQLPLWLPSKP